MGGKKGCVLVDISPPPDPESYFFTRAAGRTELSELLWRL